MRGSTLCASCLGAILMSWVGHGISPAADPPQTTVVQPPKKDPANTAKPVQVQTSLDKVKPQWKIGDQWVIQTSTKPFQHRDAHLPQKMQQVQWKFQVEKVVKLAGRNCYQIKVGVNKTQDQEAIPQPETTVWVDQETLSLRQIQTQMPVPDGFRTITESYSFGKSNASPVIGLLTVLPLDLPVFLSNKAKSLDSYTYETHAHPLEAKAVGEVSFAYEVKQEISQPDPAKIRGLLHENYAKSLQQDPVVQVKLERIDRNVHQLWQANRPWPVFTTNGNTTSRLIQSTPANPNQN